MQKKTFEYILLTAVLLLVGCTAESHYKKAMALLESDEVDAAVEHLQKAVDKGHAEALYQLGKLYDEGKKVEPNRQKALELFRKAAESGSVDAQTTIGGFYLLNENKLLQDKDKGLFWLKKASEAGNPKACLGLLRFYLSELNLSQRARREKAEKQKEEFDPRVLTKAEKEIMESAKSVASKIMMTDADEEGIATMFFSYLYENGISVSSSRKKAIECAEFAATKENRGALTYLALTYSDTKGNSLDYAKAVKYFKKILAKREVVEGRSHNEYWYLKLAKIYLDDSWEGADASIAVDYMEQAEKEGNTEYNNELNRTLGMCYYEGKGTRKDMKQAFKYLKLAVEHFDQEAALLLGELYYDGKNLPEKMSREQQLEEAEKCFRRARIVIEREDDDEKLKDDVKAVIDQIEKELKKIRGW